MKLVFEDYSSDNLPGRTFGDASELALFLEGQKTISMMGSLTCENGWLLDIGIDGNICTIQYRDKEGDPPYMMALTPEQIVEESHFFDCGGSATEVDARNCLPFDLFLKVVLHFFETGQMSGEVDWEEV